MDALLVSSAGARHRLLYEDCVVRELQFPAIAQLVERLTVEVSQLSGGPWFESVLPDYFFNVLRKSLKFCRQL